MISMILSFVLGILVIICLLLKLTRQQLSKSWDIAICIVVPIMCLLTFVAIILETSIRRNVNYRELDKLLSVVELCLNSDRVFTSNEEKCRCIDSLKMCSEELCTLAYNDSLIAMIAGKDTCMQRRIVQANNAVNQSVKWLSRLNDLYEKRVAYDKKEFDKDIRLIGPGADSSTIMNIAFKIKDVHNQALCAYVQVHNCGEILYAQAFNLNIDLNCFNVPTFNQEGDIIDFGYIYNNDNELIFKYITYAK